MEEIFKERIFKVGLTLEFSSHTYIKLSDLFDYFGEEFDASDKDLLAEKLKQYADGDDGTGGSVSIFKDAFPHSAIPKNGDDNRDIYGNSMVSVSARTVDSFREVSEDTGANLEFEHYTSCYE